MFYISKVAKRKKENVQKDLIKSSKHLISEDTNYFKYVFCERFTFKGYFQ